MTTEFNINNDPYRGFLLSYYPSLIIDNGLLHAPVLLEATKWSKAAARVVALVTSVAVLPITLVADLAFMTVRGIGNRALSFTPLASEKFKKESYVQSLKCYAVALKCIRALPIYLAAAAVIYKFRFSKPSYLASALLSMGAFVYPGIISNHFLPEKPVVPIIYPKDGSCPYKSDTIRPTGGAYEAEAKIYCPQHKEHVQMVVRDAANKRLKVSIIGAGFSQGAHTLPPKGSIALDLRLMNSVSVDGEIATVGGGALWKDVQDEAEKTQMAVEVMQASNVFSVGGSLSAPCHGYAHKAGTVSNTVTEITIVNAQGELETIHPEDDLFKYVSGGWGMFGVIVEVKLKLVANEELFDSGERVELEDYPQYIIDNALQNGNAAMHLFRLSLEVGKLLQYGFAQTYYTAHSSGRGTPTGEAHEANRGTWVERILMNVARKSSWIRNRYWAGEKASLSLVHKTDRNSAMRPKINATMVSNSKAEQEWLQEYFVTPANFPVFTRKLGKILDANNVKLLNASGRYVKKDEISVMGYARKADCIAIVLFFTQSLNESKVAQTRRWVQQVIGNLKAEEGESFYLPYAHLAKKDQVTEFYGKPLKTVRDKKLEFDPHRMFVSQFTADVLGIE
ncbi:MAG: FAD-binding oxidoreductase [Rhabdochlamydiaceae bacterium]|nr:FAD-binding oxidoreductase [Candidatus Amphrikana amoebophyrae]